MESWKTGAAPPGASALVSGAKPGKLAAMWRVLVELLEYLRQERKWWLIPIVLLLVGLGALLIFGSSSGLGWAIYPFM